MTRVAWRADGPRRRLWVRGHARGSPAACAGISALTNALALYLQNDPDVRLRALEEGEARFRLDFSGGSAAHGAWAAAVLGLISIARACPRQVALVPPPVPGENAHPTEEDLSWDCFG